MSSMDEREKEREVLQRRKGRRGMKESLMNENSGTDLNSSII